MYKLDLGQKKVGQSPLSSPEGIAASPAGGTLKSSPLYGSAGSSSLFYSNKSASPHSPSYSSSSSSPRCSPSYSSSSSSPCSSPSITQKNKGLFFKNKSASKELERRRHRTPSLKAAEELKDYPPEHRGFLEIHSEIVVFNSQLRSILGINSFADPSTLGLFSSKRTELDLSKKPLLSASGKGRISSAIKANSRENLLENLCLYDRCMSYWLSEIPDLYSLYQQRMKNIFFDNAVFNNMACVFKEIPKYSQLEEEIQLNISEKKYNLRYKRLMDSLKDYNRIYFREHSLAHLENSVLQNAKTIASFKDHIEESPKKGGGIEINLMNSEEDNVKKFEHEIISVERKIKKEGVLLTNENFALVKKFRKKAKLSAEFFDVFSTLRAEEASAHTMPIAGLPDELPNWNAAPFSYENSLETCLYFFGKLCNRRPKFYDMLPGETLNDIYINDDFIGEFSEIHTVEEFKNFLLKTKQAYDQGLLEIVISTTLDHIMENARITIHYHEIIEEALQKARDAYPELKECSFNQYSKEFFEVAMTYVFKKIDSTPILKSSAQGQEEIEIFYPDPDSDPDTTEASSSSRCFGLFS